MKSEQVRAAKMGCISVKSKLNSFDLHHFSRDAISGKYFSKRENLHSITTEWNGQRYK